MAPTFDVLQQQKNHLVTSDIFRGAWVGLNRKRDFDVLRNKLGMDVAPSQEPVENPRVSKIVSGYVFDFTKLHEELLFK